MMYFLTVPLPTPDGPLKIMSKPFFIVIVYYFSELTNIVQLFVVLFCYDVKDELLLSFFF